MKPIKRQETQSSEERQIKEEQRKHQRIMLKEVEERGKTMKEDSDVPISSKQFLGAR